MDSLYLSSFQATSAVLIPDLDAYSFHALISLLIQHCDNGFFKHICLCLDCQRTGFAIAYDIKVSASGTLHADGLNHRSLEQLISPLIDRQLPSEIQKVRTLVDTTNIGLT